MGDQNDGVKKNIVFVRAATLSSMQEELEIINTVSFQTNEGVIFYKTLQLCFLHRRVPGSQYLFLRCGQMIFLSQK